MKSLASSWTKFSLIIVLSVLSLGAYLNKTNNFLEQPAHIGIVVSDLEKSLDFYTNVIGLTKVGEFSLDQTLVNDLNLTEGKRSKVVFLKFNDEPSAPTYKLVKVEGLTTKPIKSKHCFKPGLRYLTIYVEDLAPYLERLKERKIELINKVTPISINNQIELVLFQDPDGALIELIARSDR